MQRLCVFCGANPGKQPCYIEQARALGTAIAKTGITLIYGGAGVGLMGALADAALEAGGEVIGIIPQALMEKEVGHIRLTQMHVVNSMHQRKALMAEMTNGFIALPGGIGTMEELFEVWTWAQLGYHDKPCALLNVEGYYNPLIRFIDQMTHQGFIRPEHRDMLIVAPDIPALFKRLEAYKPPQTARWIASHQR